VAGACCLTVRSVPAQEKKDKDEPAEKKGTVVGVVVEKGKISIKVQAFGEEKGRDYFPKWIGGMPAAGGGLDKKMLATFEKLKIGQKIHLVWEYDERFRAVTIEVLDKDATPKEKN
jgi:hypothetical protein